MSGVPKLSRVLKVLALAPGEWGDNLSFIVGISSAGDICTYMSPLPPDQIRQKLGASDRYRQLDPHGSGERNPGKLLDSRA